MFKTIGYRYIVVLLSMRPDGAEMLLHPLDHTPAGDSDIGRAIVEGNAVDVVVVRFSGELVSGTDREKETETFPGIGALIGFACSGCGGDAFESPIRERVKHERTVSRRARKLRQ